MTTGSNGGLNAGPGYDAVTGLGTPIANLLVPDLAAYGMATQLAVTDQPPTNVLVGHPFNMVITAEDANGHVDSSYNGSITLTLPANGSIHTGTVTAIHGVARFTDIDIVATATGDTIQATANGLTEATSNSFNVVTALPTGTWQSLAATGSGPSGTIALMLLSDGTVMAQGPASGPAYSPTTTWYQLTPDSSGNYATGNWTQLDSMHEGRRFSTTAMLPNGDVFIVGGEYSTPDPFTNTAEIFDPTANGGAGSWTNVDSVPTPTTNVDLYGTVTGASNASPIVITSPSTYQLQNGQTVVITGVAGNTNANGTWTIAGLTATTFQLVRLEPATAITRAAARGTLTFPSSATTRFRSCRSGPMGSPRSWRGASTIRRRIFSTPRTPRDPSGQRRRPARTSCTTTLAMRRVGSSSPMAAFSATTSSRA